MVKPTPMIPASTAPVTSPIQTLITPVQSSGPTAFVATSKSFENSTTIRPIPQIIKPIITSSNMPLPSKGGFHPLTAPTPSTSAPASTSGFYLDPRTELRPDDGLKPLGDIPKTSSSITTTLIGTNVPLKENTSAFSSSSVNPMEMSSTIPDTHNDSINQLRCEETIPGSPASVITGREDSQERTATSLVQDPVVGEKDFSTLGSNKGQTTADVTATSTTASVSGGGGGNIAVAAVANASSSPNDSGSQEDESSEDIKKESGVSPNKRRRTRKQGDSNNSLGMDQQQQQQQQLQQHTKRRRALTINKNKTGINLLLYFLCIVVNEAGL